MAETTFTLDEYLALNKAIVQGTTSVSYGDKTITYRSLDEMLRIRRLMAAELGITPKNSGRKLAVFSKSWNDNETQLDR